jgi:hypothetical protein
MSESLTESLKKVLGVLFVTKYLSKDSIERSQFHVF